MLPPLFFKSIERKECFDDQIYFYFFKGITLLLRFRYVKQFSKLRVELTAKLFTMYNSTVFEDQVLIKLVYRHCTMEHGFNCV